MTKSPAWTPAENTALVALYFAMLDRATTGQPYNKAAMIRHAMNTIERDHPNEYGGILYNRSKQSIEFKLMNATAAHQALMPDAETMHGHGYRAMPNMQAALKQAMQAEIYRREVGAHNVGTCKHCGWPYRYNNMNYHDKGYCSRECLAATEAAA